MGKKKSRTKQVSKGEIGSPMKTKLRHYEEGYAAQRIIKNPNGSETNKRYIRVPARDVWKSSKR